MMRFKRFLHVAALMSAAVGAWLAAPAHAIVSSTDPANWLGSADPRLSGVGQVQFSGGGSCSASLLDGGAWVLTAAHCVAPSGGQVSFLGGTVTALFSQASQVHVFPTWTGVGDNGSGLGHNNDLALIQLDQAVTQVAGYALYGGADPIGLDVLVTGYGQTGLGTTGATAGTGGTLHWGRNTYDTRLVGGLSAVFDFDNGASANNLFGGLGLGTAEASLASGDSGGASFIDVGGSLRLVGVHSFIGRDDQGLADVDGSLNSSFGEFAGDTELVTQANRDWLLAVTAVPEPAAAWLWGLGLLAIAVRRARSVKSPACPIA